MARELDAKLWSTLPTELMDVVLQHLPISSVCKFRAVCKHWNKFLTVSAKDPYFLCFPKSDLEFGHDHRCKVYSFIRNQWEDLDLSFLAPLVAQHCLGEDSYGTIRLESSCSDGGLLCLSGTISNNPRRDSDKVEKSFLLVCNPLTRTTEFVDCFHPNETTDYLIYRNPYSGVYRIFVVVVTHHVDYCYYMYDSKSEVWLLLLTFTQDDIEVKNLRSCSIVFNGFYYLLCCGDKFTYQLFAYNFNEHELLKGGGKTEIPASCRSLSFVVSNNCLLLLAKTMRNGTRVYRINEMKLSRLDGSEGIELPKELDWYKAFGYEDFILFVNEGQTDFTVVDIADPEAVKTRAILLCPTRLSASNPIYERVTFNFASKFCVANLWLQFVGNQQI